MSNEQARSSRNGSGPSKHRRRRNPNSKNRPQSNRGRTQAAPRRPARRHISPNAIEVSELEGVFGTVHEKLQNALAEMGFRRGTDIQEQSIPHLLKGKDMIGCAQTGTGKTAAFGLPILQLLMAAESRREPKRPRALILAPTRELAAQIEETLLDIGRFTGLRPAVIFGGVGQGPQVDALRHGVDILVATPGRLLDLMEQKHLFLDCIEFFVLDEADRMLDMGFLPDIKRVLKVLPKKRQSLMFSATMPGPIRQLVNDIVIEPEEITIAPEKPAVEAIDQQLRYVSKSDKRSALLALLEESPEAERVIVFTRMKHVANRLAEYLERAKISTTAIHGNKTQNARTKALDRFRKGKVRVLVATDIAARGIDVPNINLVVNFDLPEEAETYVHRIGRTARAGASGHAVAFCESADRKYLRGIERLIRKSITVNSEHRHHSADAQKEGHGGGAGGYSRGRKPSRGRPPRRRQSR